MLINNLFLISIIVILTFLKNRMEFLTFSYKFDKRYEKKLEILALGTKD